MSKSLGFSGEKKIHHLEIGKISKVMNIIPKMECGEMTHCNMNLQCDITVQSSNTRIGENENANDKIWKYFSMTIFIFISAFFLTYAWSIYEPKEKFIVPSLIAVAVVIALMTWFRNMLSMNMFHKEKRNKARYFALILYLLAGTCFLASSLAVMQQDSVIQFTSSFAGSIIGWKGFVVVFEGSYRLPTKQQLAALLQILILSGLWELRTFLVNLHFKAEIDG